MKRKWILILTACLLWTINANALIVSVNGEGNIPEEGMEIILTDAEEDPLTGEMVVELKGTLLCSEPLTVTISRSTTGITDEFCCAGECTGGNGQTNEVLAFTPGGLVNWFAHFTPADSYATVVYTFSTASESRVLTVHYQVTQAIETVSGLPESDSRKILHNGIVYIIKNGKIYHL